MKIKLKRIAKGWTQEDLSKEAGVSRNTIVKLEKGDTDGIRFGIIKKIAAALDTTVQELFFSDEE
ncbi:helix-turn-helix transcriptional regulator [Clostridium sp. B9]|uniref:helix-turn-helix transcriptional regulator n=1 Tax=Clostridium sp. B9 TaxID=3423224 RepID=UPI003D2EB7EE